MAGAAGHKRQIATCGEIYKCGEKTARDSPPPYGGAGQRVYPSRTQKAAQAVGPHLAHRNLVPVPLLPAARSLESPIRHSRNGTPCACRGTSRIATGQNRDRVIRSVLGGYGGDAGGASDAGLSALSALSALSRFSWRCVLTAINSSHAQQLEVGNKKERQLGRSRKSIVVGKPIQDSLAGVGANLGFLGEADVLAE